MSAVAALPIHPPDEKRSEFRQVESPWNTGLRSRVPYTRKPLVALGALRTRRYAPPNSTNTNSIS